MRVGGGGGGVGGARREWVGRKRDGRARGRDRRRGWQGGGGHGRGCGQGSVLQRNQRCGEWVSLWCRHGWWRGGSGGWRRARARGDVDAGGDGPAGGACCLARLPPPPPPPLWPPRLRAGGVGTPHASAPGRRAQGAAVRAAATAAPTTDVIWTPGPPPPPARPAWGASTSKSMRRPAAGGGSRCCCWRRGGAACRPRPPGRRVALGARLPQRWPRTAVGRAAQRVPRRRWRRGGAWPRRSVAGRWRGRGRRARARLRGGPTTRGPCLCIPIFATRPGNTATPPCLVHAARRCHGSAATAARRRTRGPRARQHLYRRPRRRRRRRQHSTACPTWRRRRAPRGRGGWWARGSWCARWLPQLPHHPLAQPRTPPAERAA